MENNLLTDYLNKNSHILDEKVVVKSQIDYGDFIATAIEWQSEEGLQESTISISLFDLISFIYSKNQEK